MEIVAVNRAERVRKRAWREALNGDFRLFGLAQEAHMIRFVGPERVFRLY